ncbi:MAG: hypothetical protein IK115_08070 [Lachnospiraceae bacterium]|nr:hypothetical protein [Lachnospiraceae bacterium]
MSFPILLILTVSLLLSCGATREAVPAPPVESASENVQVTPEDSAPEPVSVNTLSADTVSEDTVSEDSVSDDSVSEDSVSEDSVSEDSVSEDSASEDEAKKPKKPKPINMIIDTDFTTDADDVAALRVATSLAKLGKINIVGAMGSGPGEGVPRGIHACLCYDGFPNVPVGQGHHDDIPIDEIYTWGLAGRYWDGATYNCADSVDQYKNVLTQYALKGEKVRIVVIGFLVNIADLLADPEGYMLVASTVDSIWIDGGVYPDKGTDFNFCFGGGVTEAAIFTFNHCPVPMCFITNATGADTARAVKCGSQLSVLDPGMVDPVHLAYDAFEKCYEKDLSGGHFAYDALAVWAAALDSTESYLTLTPVIAEMFPNGCNLFTPTDDPNSLRFIVERALPGLEFYEASIDALIYAGVK